jgi:probable rRNA maturation factor
MIFVEVEPGPFESAPADLAERAAAATLSHESASDADLTLVLTGDERLQALNREFLGKDRPTDVLSFPAGETGPDPDTGRRYLGDVLVSVPRAAEQATARGHPLAAELQLLAVHGVLHLLGHDHLSKVDKARMWAAQSEVLTGLGLSPAIVHEDD